MTVRVGPISPHTGARSVNWMTSSNPAPLQAPRRTSRLSLHVTLMVVRGALRSDHVTSSPEASCNPSGVPCVSRCTTGARPLKRDRCRYVLETSEKRRSRRFAPEVHGNLRPRHLRQRFQFIAQSLAGAQIAKRERLDDVDGPDPNRDVVGHLALVRCSGCLTPRISCKGRAFRLLGRGPCQLHALVRRRVFICWARLSCQ